MQRLSKRLQGQEIKILNELQAKGGYKYDFDVMAEYGVGPSSEAWGRTIDEWCKEFNYILVPRTRNAFPESYRPVELRLMAEYSRMSFAIKAAAKAQALVDQKRERIVELEQELFEEELKQAGMKECREEVILI